MKYCYECKTDKEFSEFNKNRSTKDGHQDLCRNCQREAKRKWAEKYPGRSAEVSARARAKDPAKANAHSKKWRDANPDKVKSCFLKRYNLTLEQWNQMFEAQGGKCLVCDTHQDDLAKELAVDHCHETGKVRGLLCAPCNRAIGLLGDSRDRLLRAAAYLDLPRPS